MANGPDLADAPRVSLQEQFFPGMTCFGCGPANSKGLRLRSFPAGDGSGTETTAQFEPWPEHDNGLGFLNGGIICTVLDCHSATPMVLMAANLGLVRAGSPLPFVTAGLDVRYLRPTPLDAALQLRAEVLVADEASMTVEAELSWDGKVRAVATAQWRRWHPR